MYIHTTDIQQQDCSGYFLCKMCFCTRRFTENWLTQVHPFYEFMSRLLCREKCTPAVHKSVHARDKHARVCVTTSTSYVLYTYIYPHTWLRCRVMQSRAQSPKTRQPTTKHLCRADTADTKSLVRCACVLCESRFGYSVEEFISTYLCLCILNTF